VGIRVNNFKGFFLSLTVYSSVTVCDTVLTLSIIVVYYPHVLHD